MMKISMGYVVVLVFGIVFAVQADPRIDLSTESCHFPYDETNADNEHKVSCQGSLKEIAGVGAIAGWARVVLDEVHHAVAPAIARVTWEDTDAIACTLVNDAGQVTTVPTHWVGDVRTQCVDTRCRVVYELRCGSYD